MNSYQHSKNQDISAICAVPFMYSIFSKKSGPIRNFIWVSETISKFRKKLKIQFQKKKRQPDGQKDGRTEGQTDRPYFVGPFSLSPEIQVSSSQAKAKSTANTNRISCSASWKKFQVSNWAINRPLYGVKRFRDTHKKWIKIFSLIKL